MGSPIFALAWSEGRASARPRAIDVEAKVRDGAERLARLGATVEEIALPIHGVGRAIWTPTIIEGAVDLLMRGNACGTNRPGLFVNSLSEAYSRWREHADELSVSLKLVMLVGEFVSRQYGGRFYGKSQNLIRKMREDYDRVFELRPLADADHAAEGHAAAGPGRVGGGDVRGRPQHTCNTSPFCVSAAPVTPRSRYPAARATACRSA